MILIILLDFRSNLYFNVYYQWRIQDLFLEGGRRGLCQGDSGKKIIESFDGWMAVEVKVIKGVLDTFLLKLGLK